MIRRRLPRTCAATPTAPWCLFVYASEGGVHDWGTESWRANLADFIKFPGVQAYWKDRQHTYHDALQVEVDVSLRKAGALLSESYDTPGAGASGDSVGTA